MVDGLVPICRQFRAPRGLSGRQNRLIGGVMRGTGPREVVGTNSADPADSLGPPRGLSGRQNRPNRWGYEGAGVLARVFIKSWGYHFVVAMVIHQHIGTHRKKGFDCLNCHLCVCRSLFEEWPLLV